MKWVSPPSTSVKGESPGFFFTSFFPFLKSEECCDLEESPGSLQPSETSSNGAVEDSGSLWSSLGSNTMSAASGSCQGSVGLGPGVSYQDSARRCSQRKKCDTLLLGCASLLASVALGQDLLQLGKLQVRPERRWESPSERHKFRGI